MRPSSPHDAKASVVRPYTLSKKSRYLVTLQFSLTSSNSVFKDRIKTVHSLRPGSAGGGSRIRTGDILLAKQTLYQLSYTPSRQMDCLIVGLLDRLIVGFGFHPSPFTFHPSPFTFHPSPFIHHLALVGLTRVELVTSSLSGTRSNQLSYKPLVFRKGDGTLC